MTYFKHVKSFLSAVTCICLDACFIQYDTCMFSCDLFIVSECQSIRRNVSIRFNLGTASNHFSSYIFGFRYRIHSFVVRDNFRCKQTFRHRTEDHSKRQSDCEQVSHIL